MRMGTIISLTGLLTVLHGCFDNSFMGAPSGDNAGFDEPVPVLVEVGDPAMPKGAGVMDNIYLNAGENVFVYAFKDDMLTSYRRTSREDRVNTLIDASVDFPGSRLGRRAVTNSSGEALLWPDAKEMWCYHDGDLKQVPYDFYAYYLDDVNIGEDDVVREDDCVKLNVEIDGSQDLMSAKAELVNDQLEIFDEAEQKRLMEYRFSYYTGLRNALPRFYFKHHLVMLDFELVPGFVEGEVKNVTLQAIEVESRYKGVFTVANKSNANQMGVDFPDKEYRDMVLRESDGSPIPDNKYKLKTLDYSGQIAKSVPVDGNLLVAPQKDSIIAYVTMKQTRTDGTLLAQARNRVALSYSKGGKYGSFDAGNRYKVKLQVYGVTTIYTTVTVEPWLSGGDVSIDTEDKPEI